GEPADSGAGGDSDQARAATLRAAVERIVDKYDLAVEDETLRRVTYYLVRDWVHTGVIDPFLQDPRVEEISCDGDDIPIFLYHRDYESLQTNRAFPSGELRPFVTKLAQRAGKDLSIANPLEGAALPSGSRVELTLGETTERGPTFTVRKFREDPYTMADLVHLGTFNPEVLAYVWEAIVNNLSILVVGGTASGKTTTLNAISPCIPPKTKIVSIEDTRELQLPHQNWVPHLTREGFAEESGIGMQALLRHALRQRPELIAVGEVRGAEAGVLFQAMNTGHQALSTLHADSVRGLISRLENPPMAVERELISELDIIVIQAQVTVEDERERRCTDIAELYDLDPDTRDLETRTVYAWDEATDTITRRADSRHLERLAERGRKPFQSIEQRRKVLDFLVAHDITDHDDVAAVLHAYYLAPDRVRKQVANGALDLDALRAIRERALSADIRTPGESDLTAGGTDAGPNADAE
ncbi:MAG: type II/IV secretion system ATPase subunit, partial [Salinirussus sp.]